MIGRLAGILLEKNPPEIVVDAGGVGYEVSVPMSTFYDLPIAGDKVSLWTHLVVREDAQLLFGFLTQRERAIFRELIRIAGVGPRTALSVLNPRERRIFEARRLAEDPITLEELSTEFGVSRERVRQIEGKALKRLAEARELQGMADAA